MIWYNRLTGWVATATPGGRDLRGTSIAPRGLASPAEEVRIMRYMVAGNDWVKASEGRR